MSTYQQIVDDICSILYSDVDPSEEELEKLVADYVSANEQINRDLRECDELLHRGLRDEAIQKCEAGKLLDRVAILDFAEREHWANYVSACGLPAPPDIEVDRAAEISEAYAAQQPLAPLMRLHRLHALARSPLSARIAVMRKIRKRDYENPVWDRSLREFEQARCTQISGELDQATKAKDFRTLAALEQELGKSVWSVRPPKSLIKKASLEHKRLRQERAREELDRLQVALNDAYGEQDAGKARVLRGRWNAAALIAGLNDDDPLMDLVGPALGWLAEEDSREAEQQSYEDNLHALESALDGWAPYEELRGIHDAMVRSDQEIPEKYRAQLADRFSHFEEKATRKQRMKIGAAVVSVAVLALATGVGIMFYQRSQHLDQTAAALTSLVEDGKLKQASEILTKIEQDEPDLGVHPRIAKIRADLHSRIEAEDQRRGRLMQLVQAARDALSDATWDSFPEAEQHLTEATPLARTDGEQTSITEVRSEIGRLRRELEREAGLRFSKDFDALTTRLRDLSRGDILTLTELITSAEQLEKREHVPDGMMKNLWELLTNMRSRYATTRGQIEKVKSLEQVTQTLSNRQGFSEQLTNYNKRFPGDPRAQDFESVLKTDPEIWAGVDAWNKLTKDLEFQELSTISPEDASKLTQRIRDLIKEHKGFRNEPNLRRLITYLEPITARVTSDGTTLITAWESQIRNLQRYAKVYVIRTKDARYYSDAPPINRNGTNHSFKYWADHSFSEQPGTVKEEDIRNPRIGGTLQWVASQTEFMGVVRREFQQQDQQRWETTLKNLLTKLVKDQRMDPVFKYELLLSLVQTGQKGSRCLQVALSQYEDTLTSTEIDLNANYLDPADKEGNRVRVECAELLGKLEPLETVWKKLDTELQNLRQPDLGAEYRWVGWLLKDAGDEWHCEIPDSTSPVPRRLWLVYAESPGGPPKFVQIGVLESGKVSFEPDNQTGLREGRPIYLEVARN